MRQQTTTRPLESESRACSEHPSVFHIDPDAIVAAAIRGWISGWSQVRYAGAALTARDALDACRHQKPAIVLLEPLLPDMNGVELVATLSELHHHPRVVLLTRRAEEAFLHQFVCGRIVGIVSKTPAARQDLRAALEAVGAARCWCSREIKESIRRFRQNSDAFFKVLSPRELSLLPRFGSGYSDAEIAEQVGLREATVHCHRQHIMAKLKLHGTPALMRWAHRTGFCDFAPRHTVPVSVGCKRLE